VAADRRADAEHRIDVDTLAALALGAAGAADRLIRTGAPL
jgi:hypothetical protein